MFALLLFSCTAQAFKHQAITDDGFQIFDSKAPP